MSHERDAQLDGESPAGGVQQTPEIQSSGARSGEAGTGPGANGADARYETQSVNGNSASNTKTEKSAENGQHRLNGSQEPKGQLDAEGNNTDLDNELEALALSSAITELGYAIQTILTLLFEVQELRHAAGGAKTDNTDPLTDSPATEVDVALARLDSQLDATSAEVTQLQKRIEKASVNRGDNFLQAKWSETLAQWRAAQEEAEEMRRELVEDKYLIVYRTVSKQAEDMMQSLEKIFAQCHSFVHDMYSKYAGSSTSTSNSATTFADEEALQANLNTFISLHRSLHQKSKYYVPSCEQVIRTMDSGIGQQRSLNGEVLRGHAEMKLRWRTLQDRMSRTEREMQGVQDLLSEKSEQAQKSQGKAKRSDSTASSSATSGSRSSSFSTPSKTPVARTKSSNLLTPSPQSNNNGSPTHSRAVSPFRKLANKLRSSGRGQEESPPPPVPDIPSRADRRLSHMPGASQSTSVSSNTQHTPPGNSAIPGSQQNAIAIGQHRYSQSAGYNAVGMPSTVPRPSYAASSAASDRARSPLPGTRLSTGPSVSQARPIWNSSTKPIRDDLPSSISRSSPRKSMPFDTPTRATTPANGLVSGRKTPSYPSSYSRPASRNFTAPTASYMNRSASPAFSATSNTSASAFKARPTSPNSKIPAPALSASATPTLKSSPQKGRPSLGGTMRKPSSSAPPLPDENSLETLFFRSGTPTDDQSTSILQRALSPTPSAGGYTVASSVGGTRRQSLIPVLSVSASSVQNTPMGSPVRGNGAASRQEAVFTPEPMLRSRAARASAIYGGGSGRKSLGLPPPPADGFAGNARQPKTSGASSISDASRRPLGPRQSYVSTPSGSRRMSTYTSSPAHTPFSATEDSIGQYRPNPIDPLDVELAAIVNSQPCFVRCERVDPPLSKAAAEAQAPGEKMARYAFVWSDKPVSCKLVERGAGKGRKVLVRAGGVWQDLAIHLLNQQALY